MRKYFVVFFISVFVNGCATSIKSQQVALNSGTVCCAHVSEFKYRPINNDEYSKFELNEKSPIFSFGGEKSYFAAIKPTGEFTAITIKSYFNGMMVGLYYHPIIALLDSDFNVVREDVIELGFTRPGLKEEDHMIGTIYYENLDNVKYVILYTKVFNDQNSQAHLPGSDTMFMVGNQVQFVSNAGRAIDLERSSIGRVKLMLEKLKLH